MKASFHEEAEAEFAAAIEYYEGREAGLGEDFAREVLAAIEKLIAFPTAWPTFDQDVRRCITNRFPYGVLYCVESDGIHILAVMHLHRKPSYWRHRK